MLTKADPGANSPRGLICVRGFKGRVHSHSDSTASQMVFWGMLSCQGKAQRTNTLFSRSSWLGPHALFKGHRCSTPPLRSSGRCILNYLDDWLILAQSLDTLISHIDSLLIHLETLGLCVNMQKSILAPSQSITYLGVCLDSMGMRARLSRDHVEMRARLSWDRVEMRARLSRDRAVAILSSLCHSGKAALFSWKFFRDCSDSGWRIQWYVI